MNASIDQQSCNGCRLCEKECSAVFTVFRMKAAVKVDHIPAGLESVCIRAACDCPERAIYVGEAQGVMLSGRGSDHQSWIAI